MQPRLVIVMSVVLHKEREREGNGQGVLRHSVPHTANTLQRYLPLPPPDYMYLLCSVIARGYEQGKRERASWWCAGVREAMTVLTLLKKRVAPPSFTVIVFLIPTGGGDFHEAF